MLEMKLDSGKFIIDDNNKVSVDKKIAEEIKNKFADNKDNKDKIEPSIDIVKD